MLAGGRLESPGRNLVDQEFAHPLDMINGRIVDGTPPLQTREQLARWINIPGPEYHELAGNAAVVTTASSKLWSDQPG